MSRATLGIIIGVVFGMVGLVLAVQAGNLATQWQALGEGAWGGTTDPAKEHLYLNLGLIVLGAGLLLTCLSFFRWMSVPNTPAGPGED